MLATIMADFSALAYFQKMKGKEEELSNEQLKTILAAAILRYLEGLTTVIFVLDLAEAISYETSLDGDLIECTSFVKHLGHQITFSSITETHIKQRLRKILEKLV